MKYIRAGKNITNPPPIPGNIGMLRIFFHIAHLPLPPDASHIEFVYLYSAFPFGDAELMYIWWRAELGRYNWYVRGSVVIYEIQSGRFWK